MQELRVDVTKKPVGSYFGGKRGHDVSITCPVCSKPGLLVKATNRCMQRTRHISHGFLLKLNAKNDPECQWDEPCVERAS